MGLLPIPSPRFTQGASRAGIRRAAALYDKRLRRAAHAQRGPQEWALQLQAGLQAWLPPGQRVWQGTSVLQGHSHVSPQCQSAQM